MGGAGAVKVTLTAKYFGGTRCKTQHVQNLDAAITAARHYAASLPQDVKLVVIRYPTGPGENATNEHLWAASARGEI